MKRTAGSSSTQGTLFRYWTKPSSRSTEPNTVTPSSVPPDPKKRKTTDVSDTVIDASPPAQLSVTQPLVVVAPTEKTSTIISSSSSVSQFSTTPIPSSDQTPRVIDGPSPTPAQMEIPEKVDLPPEFWDDPYQPDDTPPPAPPPAHPAPTATYTKSFFQQTGKRDARHKEVTTNHDRYGFLRDVKDDQGRRPGEKGYDGSKLLISSAEMLGMTEFDRQYWRIKREMFDTVVFFRKGSFYELYEVDSEVGQRELGLLPMSRQHGMRAVGVTDNVVMDYVGKLVRLGHRVARVDEGEKMVGGKTEILDRKVTRVFTPGTLVEEGLIGGAQSLYLVGLVEMVREDGSVKFGACVVDAGTSEFCMGEFDDDRSRTALETLFLRNRPRELLRGAVFSAETMRVVETVRLTPGEAQLDIRELEFLAAVEAEVVNGKYFGGGSEAWPGSLGECVRNGRNLAIQAFGLCLSYLRVSMIDDRLISVRNFTRLRALTTQDDDEGEIGRVPQAMILDAQTLRNLDVLRNSSGGIKDSLLDLLDKTLTKFGTRLFYKWLCAPLLKPADIQCRQDAVEDFNGAELADAALALRTLLGEMPDLDRKLSRVTTAAAAAVPLDLFLDVVRSLHKWQSVVFASPISDFGSRAKSSLLARLLTPEDAGGMLPDLSVELESLSHVFDLQLSCESCDIVASDVDPNSNFAVLEQRVAELKGQMSEYLESVKEQLETNKVRWCDPKDKKNKTAAQKKAKANKSTKGKEKDKQKAEKRFQLEITATKGVFPDVPEDWQPANDAKTVRRFVTPFGKEIAAPMIEAEDAVGRYKKDLCRQAVELFSHASDKWRRAVDVMAQLDCLQSLAATSAMLPEPRCRPVFVSSSKDAGQQFLNIVGMRHPCLLGSIENFVPNSLKLAGQGCAMLLTGPNMGGKSTLLRQTCILVLMAQLGCYVPAEVCELTPVDRIFTRIGASDNVVAGQSTFMVELQETSTVLRHATASSLVVLDELGRGTSTYDGYALAYAVLRHAAEVLKCRTLFSTHYHALAYEFVPQGVGEGTGLYYMDCHAPETGGGEGSQIVYTYQLKSGLCPESYGLDVARHVGLPYDIVMRAKQVAEDFAQKSGLRKREKAMEARSTLLALLSALKTGGAPSPAGAHTLKDKLLSLQKSCTRGGR